MNYADEFINYRAKEMISQTELGKRIGITLAAVYRIENNISAPRKTTWKRFLTLKEEESKDE